LLRFWQNTESNSTGPLIPSARAPQNFAFKINKTINYKYNKKNVKESSKKTANL
jgi:hypothetical protein